MNAAARTPQLDLFAASDEKSTDEVCGERTAATATSNRGAFEFFLGTHHADWLALTAVPLFLSRRVLERRTELPRARGPWALDSGGFTELSMHGRWTCTEKHYASLVARAHREIGNLRFAAVMDWMCEAPILKRTGLTIAEHQTRTLRSFLSLKATAPELPWMPVLQGWTRGDYLNHLEDYARAGVDLTAAPVVGVGTVCRRQHTLRAALLLAELKELGLNLHAFGFKTTGLISAKEHLASSDSLAWSLHARRNPPLPECRHRRCGNCLRFALAWRDDLLERIDLEHVA